jgi:hypothetical protein
MEFEWYGRNGNARSIQERVAVDDMERVVRFGRK